MITILFILLGFLFVAAPIVYIATQRNNNNDKKTYYYCNTNNTCTKAPDDITIYNGMKACNKSCNSSTRNPGV